VQCRQPHRKMGALLRHLINPVLADLLYCGAGVWCMVGLRWRR
jgi:hypothetical protein